MRTRLNFIATKQCPSGGFKRIDLDWQVSAIAALAPRHLRAEQYGLPRDAAVPSRQKDAADMPTDRCSLSLDSDIDIEKSRAVTTDLAARILTLMDADSAFAEGDIVVAAGQLGDGCGVPTDATLEDVRMVTRSEGLLFDPVCSRKALAGLIAAIRDGAWSSESSVLFIMTGGLPGLFAYEPAFRSE